MAGEWMSSGCLRPVGFRNVARLADQPSRSWPYAWVGRRCSCVRRGMLSTRVGPIAVSRVRASRGLAGAACALVGGEGRRDPGAVHMIGKGLAPGAPRHVVLAMGGLVTAVDTPIRLPRAVFGMMTILSQFTTESWPSPLARPTGISTDRPRAVEVTGATVTCIRCGMTISRVRTRTGRALSRCAM